MNSRLPWLRRNRPSREQTHRAIARIDDLLAAGVPASEAVRVGGNTHGGAGRLLAKASRRIERGERPSLAFARVHAALSRAEIAMLAAGERGGNLTRAVHLLRQHLDEEAESARLLTRAAAYPIALLLLTGAVVVFAGGTVLPAFSTLYAGHDVELPSITKALLVTARLVPRLGPPLALAMTVGVAMFTLAVTRSPRIRSLRDRGALAAPFIGHTIIDRERGRFYSLAGALMAAGTDLDAALALAAPAVANTAVRACCLRARRLVHTGLPLSVAVARSGFDRSSDDRGMLEVAEATGDYAGCFERLAAMATARRTDRVAIIGRLVEPLAIALVAVVVGVTVLAIYQPMLGSASLLSAGVP